MPVPLPAAYLGGLTMLSSFWTLAMREKPALSGQRGPQELGPATFPVGMLCRVGVHCKAGPRKTRINRGHEGYVGLI